VLYINGRTAVLLVQARGEMAVLTEITAVQLHYSAMDTRTESSIVRTGQRENGSSACSNCSTDTSRLYGHMD